MNDEEDKILYMEFLKGDKLALEKIIIKYKNNLMYFILKYVKNIELAEDIFQNVILYILEKKEQYDFKYSLKTYLYTIAKSKSLNCIKKNNSYTCLTENDVFYEEERLLEDIILTEERREKIIKIMKKLNEDYQQVLYLTIIEGLSYEETSKIMDKTVSQIKNLVHRARIKMKKILIEERVIELKNNRIVKLLIWVIMIGVISSGTVYAAMKIYGSMKNKANLVATYTGRIGDTDYNSIWIGTFNLAWNELIEQYIKEDIKFLEGNTELVNQLNLQTFKKGQISEEDYYIKIGPTTNHLKKEILDDIKNKFGIEEAATLEKIDFENASKQSFTIYSLLSKEFEFLAPFDRLDNSKFGNSESIIKYFGINDASDEKLNNNVEILFYNNKSDFCIKIKTKENEEIILFRTDKNKSFAEYYAEIEEKKQNYEGNKELNKNDKLKIPYIKVDTIINYDELCGKFIECDDALYIQNALQNVKFTLNESGGKITSEASIKGEVNSLINEVPRYFYYDNSFILFLKEENKEQPYMSLKVDNTDILVDVY